uniref:Uncharacterized protein n=1 Tax=Lepeophtheirus salmonis TaxID=72036 RepID=A0A0K2TC07_LEPSM
MRRSGSGRKQKVDLARYKEHALANLNSTITSIAEDLGVARSTASLWGQKIGGKSLRRVGRSLVSQKQRDKRFERPKNS